MARFTPKCVLIDLSGTVHVDNYLINGAARAIDRLKDSGINYRFVTNSSKEPIASLSKRLVNLGIQLRPKDLFTSLSATRNYILQNNIKPLLFLEDKALEDFEDIDVTSPNAVVIGLAPSLFNYEKLTAAFNLLFNGGQLIAVNKSRYFQSQQGLTLGGGAFVAALEYAADKTATVIGKPSRNFFEQSISDLQGVELEDCIMIGDDVTDDIGGAQSAGIKGILVQTGKYRAGDEDKLDQPPYMTLPSLSEAVDYILLLHSNS